MEDRQKLLEDTSAHFSQIEEDYLEQVKSTQPVLPRVHNTVQSVHSTWSVREITSYVFHDSSHLQKIGAGCILTPFLLQNQKEHWRKSLK